jgi:hypothetical protein
MTAEDRGLAEAPTCRTCRHFMPLSPGHAAICGERWGDLPWNAAVPLTTADGSCDKHNPVTRPSIEGE